MQDDSEPQPGDTQRVPPLHAVESAASSTCRELWVDGERMVSELEVADSPWPRMRGLLGRSSIEKGGGLWITPCNAIHMFFMRFAIDAVFVDTDLQVVRIHEHLRPWRMARGGKFAHSVIELPAGTASFFKLRAGDRLELR